ncbi:hypothetical protein M9Y10_038969 [Tritrichomonas musculus]|uniref:GRIP domain-containing protein n=1 Tax=Tritrichomonas musculus TaxID=1915356 RepID=A0ABR2K9V4_9EUKA
MNDFPETTDAIINADDNIETNTGSNVISASNETNENADLNSNLNSNINVNSNTDQLITIESLQAQIQKDQNEISQKETKVAKLKSLLTRSMRSDKRREQQIETLQIDLADRDRHIQALENTIKETNDFSTRQQERISQLEAELTEITNRLQSGVGSEAAQKRNERMKQMLEKSNVLYAELQTKYQKACSDLEEEKAKQLRNLNKRSPKSILVLKDNEAISLYDNGTYEIGPYLSSDSYPPNVPIQDFRSNRNENNSGHISVRSLSSGSLGQHSNSSENQASKQPLLKVYLKRVLLEFFIGDAATQQRLIPVILQLLDCTNEQITAAQRSYAEGRQIISKATSAFGF